MLEAAIVCLAMNIYHEARGEEFEGQVAVAEVTMNRVASEKFPDTVCDVVWQKNQFSWTNDGRSDKTPETEAYREAVSIATEFVDGGSNLEVGHGALWYHTSAVSPFWADHYRLLGNIGNHYFYDDGKNYAPETSPVPTLKPERNM